MIWILLEPLDFIRTDAFVSYKNNQRRSRVCVWIVAKVCPTNFLVMTKRLAPVWMVAKFLACQCSTTNSFIFEANVGQLVGKERLNQTFG
jgi:hypothetical protein